MVNRLDKDTKKKKQWNQTKPNRVGKKKRKLIEFWTSKIDYLRNHTRNSLLNKLSTSAAIVIQNQFLTEHVRNVLFAYHFFFSHFFCFRSRLCIGSNVNLFDSIKMYFWKTIKIEFKFNCRLIKMYHALNVTIICIILLMFVQQCSISFSRSIRLGDRHTVACINLILDFVASKKNLKKN